MDSVGYPLPDATQAAAPTTSGISEDPGYAAYSPLNDPTVTVSGDTTGGTNTTDTLDMLLFDTGGTQDI